MKRQQRRKVFRPQAEGLESRIVLSDNVGVNLDFNEVYAHEPMWVDAHNLAQSWTPMGSETGTVLMTPDNYPLADAWTVMDLGNYPDGTYQFNYTGTATVTFTPIGSLAGPVTTGSNGVTSGAVVVDHSLGDHHWLGMQVTNIDPAKPMDNFHLYVPGYGSNPTQMFTNQFLEQLQPFTTIRFLNWTLTNSSLQTTWASRTPANSFLATEPTPVPYEDIIELANEAHKDMWINIPVLATPDYIQGLAQLVAAKLNPGLHVYVEYGNENWNSFFSQYTQVLQAAQANPLVDQSAGAGVMIAQQSGYEMVAIAQAFDQAFGARSAQVRPIMAGFRAGPSYQQAALQFVQQNYGAPSQYFWGTAVDAYAGIYDNNQAGLTLDQIFAQLNQYIIGDMGPQLQADAAVAQSYGLQLVAYEGGQSLCEGGCGDNYNVELQAQSDPRMYQVYINLLNLWDQVGGGLFEQFTLTQAFGLWGLLPNILSTGSQKWNALMSRILPPGDANRDGTVDDPDLQILLANYGQAVTGWNQGDFNDDGVVNWADLNLLRGQINPSGFTLAQFAQAAMAGQPSVVNTVQPMEYDGYGVTYPSDLPFLSASGTVRRDTSTLGGPITLAGLDYPRGLGVAANSSVSLALNGQYARFDSTIGIDDQSTSGAPVVFSVSGDNRLLYQSPTMTGASGGVPLDLNVAGVQTLTLVVAPASGTNGSAGSADWADARLISTRNFGATTPYTLTWQVASQGKVVATQTSDSFIFTPTASGVYTVSLTVADGLGDTATQSQQVTVNLPSATIWSSTAAPATPAAGDGQSVELGVKFDSDVAGSITGIRFYKGSGNTGTHIGYLWSSTGTLLASATFSNETASGWQQVNFSTPVVIAAGTTYIASYLAPNGHYSYDQGYFTYSGVDNGVLHALSNTAAGGNGVFAYGSGGFPSGSWAATNYWVDVVFSTSVTPAVVATTPAAGATGVSTAPNITATFNEPVQGNTIVVVLKDSNGKTVPATVSYNAATATATLTPSSVLLPEATYTATMSWAQDAAGGVMTRPFSWSFSTLTVTIPSATIWSSTAVPTIPAVSDGQSVELGVKFYADVAGSITGIRFYKGSGNTGTHIGYLWSSTGTLLASATFTNETASGWQQVNFSTPVAITVGTTYIASYLAPNGHYAYDQGYFLYSGVDSGVLHAPWSPAAGGNGVFLYGSGGFPTQSWGETNYWVDVVFSTTVTPAVPSATIWSSTAAPATPAAGDGQSVELGVKFDSDVAGSITGIRFYKGSGNTGTHIGYLWSSTGTLLASATFSNETAGGWQQVNFSTPVAIVAGTTYIASYLAPNGHYAYDQGYFASSGVDNGVLHALSNAVAGGNGVFLYGSGGFPSGSWGATNYWVDVVFSTTVTPAVAATTPAGGAIGVSAAAPSITATFNEPVQGSTITFVLKDSSGKTVPAAMTYNTATATATLTPSSALAANTTYTVTVSGVQDAAGDVMASPYSWSFTTAAAGITNATIWSSTAAPVTPAANDSRSVELGVKFTSDVAGYITGIRFYKGSGNTGAHVGYLWSSGGTLLASAAFTSETATGWQQVNFSTPVAITAGTTYIASYLAPNGHYAYDQGYFASSGVDNGVLHALSNSVAGGNGVFLYGSGGFPAGTWGATNYWVDVVFSTSVSGSVGSGAARGVAVTGDGAVGNSATNSIAMGTVDLSDQDDALDLAGRSKTKKS